MTISRSYLNNFSTTLNGSISAAATSIVVTSATGITAALAAGDFVNLTIDDGTNVEIVRVTAVSTNTLTVVRARDGTTAAAFATAISIQCRITASSFSYGFDVVTRTVLAGGEANVSFTGLTAGIYEIDLAGISVTDASPPILEFVVGTGAGPTYQTSAYRYSLARSTDNSASITNVVPGATTSIVLIDSVYEDNALFPLAGKILTSNLASTAQYKLFDIDMRQTKTGFGGLSQSFKGVGAWNDSVAVTALRVRLSSGTFRAGGVITLSKRRF